MNHALEAQSHEWRETAPVTIRVGREHIEEGHAGSCRNCPIAIALNQQVGDGEWVVGVAGARHDPTGYMLELPVETRGFIRRFDRERSSVKPFFFRVQMPLALLPVAAPKHELTLVAGGVADVD